MHESFGVSSAFNTAQLIKQNSMVTCTEWVLFLGFFGRRWQKSLVIALLEKFEVIFVLIHKTTRGKVRFYFSSDTCSEFARVENVFTSWGYNRECQTDTTSWTNINLVVEQRENRLRTSQSWFRTLATSVKRNACPVIGKWWTWKALIACMRRNVEGFRKLKKRGSNIMDIGNLR